MKIEGIDFTEQDTAVLEDMRRFAEGIARAKRTSPADRVSASKIALMFSKGLEDIRHTAEQPALPLEGGK